MSTDDASTDDGPDLHQLLTSVESRLTAAGRTRLLAALQPGRSADSVRDLLSVAGLASAPSVEQLYGWHDGTKLPADGLVDDLEIIPGFYFPSLLDALAVRAAYGTDERWASSWLPILTNGAGYDFVVDLDGTTEPAVLRWEFDELDHPVAFSSLAQLAASIDQAYARSVIMVDGRGYLAMDEAEFETLAAQLLPRTTLAAELARLGPLPTDAEADHDTVRLEHWERLLDELQTARPLNDAEARQLVGLFPSDDSDCYGLAWTVVHLVESAPGWPDEDLLRSLAGPWPELLSRRAAS